MNWVLFAASTPCLLVAISSLKAEVTIDWSIDAQNAATVAVRGLTEGQLGSLAARDSWPVIFSVRVDQPEVSTALITPPMAGKYAIERDLLQFRPAFPLQAGLTYRAVFYHPDGPEAKALVSTHTVPAVPRVPTTRVEAVYPTADRIPENLLKFYVHFSAPMSRGGIYQHIHLWHEETGREVEIPFLEIGEELWDPTLTRVTLFIDPGRIKRGVRPLEEVGPALETGQSYTLRIDAAWRDGRGQALVQAYEKSFRVGPADREAPAAGEWKFGKPPRAGSREPLAVRFPEPMDRALAQRVIRVIDAAEKPLTGAVTLRDGERQWIFTPDEAWLASDYRLRAATVLEDLAGNQLGKVFEVDVFEEIDDHALPTGRWIDLPFRVGPR